MLLIDRKETQAIRIGDALVTVVKLNGGRVKLGIDAPKETPIVRSELKENK